MMTPFRCGRRGRDQERVMLRDVTLTIKLIGGPLGAEYKEIVVFF